MKNAETQLAGYFAKYDAKMARLGKALRAKLRDRLPGLFEIRELRQLRQEFPVVDRLQRILELQLRQEQLDEVVLVDGVIAGGAAGLLIEHATDGIYRHDATSQFESGVDGARHNSCPLSMMRWSGWPCCSARQRRESTSCCACDASSR